MRSSDKGRLVQSINSRLFGTDFRDGMDKEAQTHRAELGSEFGLTSQEARNLKKHLGRS